MKPDPKIRALSRPLRVSYLIEDGADSQQWLDAIIADCFSRDGGRHSLIVPVVASTISEKYQDWLQLLDPDIVFLLTFNNAALLPKLAIILPGSEIVGRERMDGQINARPNFPFEEKCLTSLSWLPFLKAQTGAFQVAPEFILDRYPAWIDDGLIGDNFGTLYDSGSAFPLHEEIATRPLMLTPLDPPDNRWHLRCKDAEEISDSDTLIALLAERGRIATLAQLSSMDCHTYNYQHSWQRGFCLVVGDSFVDRISCWNAGLLFGDFQSQPYKTLRVPHQSQSANRAAKIGKFLSRWNWIGQQNGTSRIVIRSNSCRHAEIQEFISAIQAATYSSVEFVPINSLDDCCPDDVKKAFPIRSFGGAGRPFTDARINTSAGLIEIPKPAQLAYCAGLHPVLSAGKWAVDLKIDRVRDNGKFSNERQTWRVPKTPQVISLFVTDSAARRLNQGELSVRADIRQTAIEITQPDDDTLFQLALCESPQFRHGDLRAASPVRIQYKFMETSDKGRYLTGILGMLGGLNELEHVLGNHFWRTQLMAMASPDIEKSAEVTRLLQKHLKARDGRLTIGDESGWRKLSDRVIQIARSLKSPREKTRYQWLLKSWLAELEAAMTADVQLQAQRDCLLAEAPTELGQALGYLVKCNVFYRGHEWTCHHCSHRNWVGIEALSESIPCEVCRYEHHLPIDVVLDFRLNEFFSTCLREHDTLTVAWALSHLRAQAKQCFIFAPQVSLYRNFPELQENRVDRELDILCISDGQLVVGEAKANVASIATSDIRDLAEAVSELHADIAVLAAFEGTALQMQRKAEQLRALLPQHVDVMGVISDWDHQPAFHL